MDYLRRKILILGMTVGVLIGVFLVYVVWKGLITRESIDYAKKFSLQIKERVVAVDNASTEGFSPELYQWLHKKPLSEMPQLTRTPALTEILQKVRNVFDDPKIEMSLFTDCNTKTYARCYHDSDMDVIRPEFPNPTVGYDPKSRPYYLATRTHTDWVLLNFMLRGQSRTSDYPPTYGSVLVKHILKNSAEEKELALLAKDREKLSHYMQNEMGIWLSFWSSDAATFPNASLLRSVAKGKMDAFQSFDIFYQNLRFPKKVLTGEGPLQVVCDATSALLGPFSYKATVPCHINGEPIQFIFSKTYDHPAHLLALMLGFFSLLAIAFWFFNYVEGLQDQNIQKIIGAKLVHDLKKGIVTQLDNLHQEFGNDLEEEAARPDFISRLQTKLAEHFAHLQILHKYMNLLSNNLNRKKEQTWVPLTPEKFKEYLGWILGPVPMTFQESLLQGGLFLECVMNTQEILCKTTVPFPNFVVPEMAMYRILKNIWENFNAYGAGEFLISIERKSGGMLLKTRNPISSQKISGETSTHLGMMIIRQLLEDNFGRQSKIRQEQKRGLFTLEIFFPDGGATL